MENNSTCLNSQTNKKEPEPFLGLLMLDTNFPRYKGDIANPETFTFPVKQRIIPNAHPEAIIRQSPRQFLIPFIEAARELEIAGAKLVSTSCGFLTLFQKELQAAVSVPLLTSSLFLHIHLQRLLGEGKEVGILTIAASSLSVAHLKAANIEKNVPIGTTESGSEFTPAILENRNTLNFKKAEADNVEAAKELVRRHPNISALLLECTNMPPYADAIGKATGLPIFSINDGLNALWRGKLSDIMLR